MNDASSNYTHVENPMPPDCNKNLPHIAGGFPLITTTLDYQIKREAALCTGQDVTPNPIHISSGLNYYPARQL